MATMVPCSANSRAILRHVSLSSPVGKKDRDIIAGVTKMYGNAITKLARAYMSVARRRTSWVTRVLSKPRIAPGGKAQLTTSSQAYFGADM
jgi:hypothetical protein